jgi:hypothetical protein
MEGTMLLFSDYSSPRVDAITALRQLREAVEARSGLKLEWRAMAIAEVKLLELGSDYVVHAQRLQGHAPPTVAEVDAMLDAVDPEPVKVACLCEGAGCCVCGHSGIEFEGRAA